MKFTVRLTPQELDHVNQTIRILYEIQEKLGKDDDIDKAIQVLEGLED